MTFLYQYYLETDKSSTKLDPSKPAPARSGSTLWQHVDLSNPAGREWLENEAQLDKLTVQALAAEETRPRSLASNNGMLVVLRGVNHNPGADQEDMVSIRFWIEKNRIISARLRKLLAVQDIIAAMETGQSPRSSSEFLVTVIELLADRIGEFVNRIEDELSLTEDELETIKASEMRARLGDLRRQIASVRRFLAPQRDALDRLYRIENDLIEERDRQKLREESDRVSRYLEDLDLARERALVLQEAFLSQIAQQQNSRMYVLSIVTAVFLPLSFLTGLLGMNVGGLPGVDNADGFGVAALLMLVLSVIILILLKLKKWI